jgi:hypothetical protein
MGFLFCRLCAELELDSWFKINEVVDGLDRCVIDRWRKAVIPGFVSYSGNDGAAIHAAALGV